MPSVRGASGVTLNSYTLQCRRAARLRCAPAIRRSAAGGPELPGPSRRSENLGRGSGSAATSRPAQHDGICPPASFFPDENVRSQADYEAYARQMAAPRITGRHLQDGRRCDGRGRSAIAGTRADGIRICDSSTMPSLVGSNTNANDHDRRKGVGHDPRQTSETTFRFVGRRKECRKS